MQNLSILWIFCIFLLPSVNQGFEILKVPVQLKSGEVKPGELIINTMYGVGLYQGKVKGAIGLQQQEQLLLIKYSDSELVLPETKVNKKNLYCKKSVEKGQALDSVFNTKKWDKTLQASKEKAKGLAFSLIRLRAVRNKVYRTPYLINQARYREFEKKFKYPPTEDQRICFLDVENDMVKSSIPMDRLICGDVGFGKTEVAMRAAYRAYLSGRQTVVLAPTRTLASQHLRTFRERMPEVNVQPLRGNMGREAIRVRQMLANGSCEVVIGTQAVLSNTTTLKKPGLVIIDEEHRFGVLQKEQIKAASTHMDVLTLTATPIPRTLDIVMREVMNVSYLNSPPKNRKAVNVSVYEKSGGKSDEKSTGEVGMLMDNLDVIVEAITRELKRDGQIFVVVPLISEVNRTVEFFRRVLDSQGFNSTNITYAHGNCSDLEQRVEDFGQRKSSILVATTVIENGIDMPNVNTILVLYADRFGLSTLYQLRGRVGRSETQAYAYFIANQTRSTPGSVTPAEDWAKRLDVINKYTDLGAGFNISREDRDMRGSGSIFGISQSGTGNTLSFDIAMDQLEDIVKELSYDIHLPIPNPLIQINDLVEQLSNLPTINKNNQIAATEGEIARYEEQLLRNVFQNMVRQSGVTTVNIDVEVVDAMSIAEKDKIREKCTFWSEVFRINAESKMVMLLKHLNRRLLFRVFSKQAGISRIYIEGGQLKLSLKGLTPRKWNNIVACNSALKPFTRQLKAANSCVELILDAKLDKKFFDLLQALAEATENAVKGFIEDPEEMESYYYEKKQSKMEKELARNKIADNEKSLQSKERAKEIRKSMPIGHYSD